MAIQNLSEIISLDLQEVKPCMKKASVKVSASNIAELFKEKLAEIAGLVTLPGFRKGKAPLSLVQNHYKYAIKEEVKRDILEATIKKVYSTTENGKALDMLSYNLDPGTVALNEGEDLVFSFDFDFAPEIKLPDYKNIKPELRCEEPTEKEVEEHIQHLRDRYGDYADVDGHVKENDMLEISISSDIDLPENTPNHIMRLVKSERTWIWNREEETIPGMKKALLEAKTGDTVEFPVEFPEDFQEKDLAGKKGNYKVTLFKIRRFVPLSDDNELCKNLKIESMDELRQRIKRNLEEAKQAEYELKLRSEYLNKIDSATEAFPLPEFLLNRFASDEINNYINREIRTEDEAKSFLDNKEEKINELKKIATIKLRRFLIVRQLARVEGVKVDDKDISATIKQLSRVYSVPEERLIKNLNSSALENLHMGILEDKLSAYLVKKYLKKEEKKEEAD